jgi:hypothetical protein
VTKSIIENAVGIKMWHSLRRLSDAIVEERIRDLEDETPIGGSYCNLTSKVDEELSSAQLKVIARALKVNIMQEVNKFNQRARDINNQQQQWMAFSKKLTDQFGALKEQIKTLKTQLKKEIGDSQNS